MWTKSIGIIFFSKLNFVKNNFRSFNWSYFSYYSGHLIWAIANNLKVLIIPKNVFDEKRLSTLFLSWPMQGVRHLAYFLWRKKLVKLIKNVTVRLFQDNLCICGTIIYLWHNFVYGCSSRSLIFWIFKILSEKRVSIILVIITWIYHFNRARDLRL